MTELRYEINKDINGTVTHQYDSSDIIDIFTVKMYLGKNLICKVSIWHLNLIRSYYNSDQTCDIKWELGQIEMKKDYIEYKSKLIKYILTHFTEPIFFHAVSLESMKFHFQCGANFSQPWYIGYFCTGDKFMIYNVDKEEGIKYSKQLYPLSTLEEIEEMWILNTSKKPHYICSNSECGSFNMHYWDCDISDIRVQNRLVLTKPLAELSESELRDALVKEQYITRQKANQIKDKEELLWNIRMMSEIFIDSCEEKYSMRKPYIFVRVSNFKTVINFKVKVENIQALNSLLDFIDYAEKGDLNEVRLQVKQSENKLISAYGENITEEIAAETLIIALINHDCPLVIKYCIRIINSMSRLNVLQTETTFNDSISNSWEFEIEKSLFEAHLKPEMSSFNDNLNSHVLIQFQ